MILRDRVQIIEGVTTTDDYGDTVTDWDNPLVISTTPAQVDYRVSDVALTTNTLRTTTKLVAIVARWSGYNAKKHRLRWRGKQYTPDGDASMVYANGRLHHVEIPLKYVTG